MQEIIAQLEGLQEVTLRLRPTYDPNIGHERIASGFSSLSKANQHLIQALAYLKDAKVWLRITED